MGIKNPVGKTLDYGERTARIIGVIKDFHCVPLNNQIPPLVLELEADPSGFYNLNVLVRLDPDNIASGLSILRDKWTKINPSYPFEYSFVDADFAAQYSVEDRLANIIMTFTLIGIIIATLGLLGLASFSAERRTKEIGIRKILGATVPNVVNLLSKEFIYLVIISNVFAWPLAYFVINNWLQAFAYRTNITIWTLLLPTLLVLPATMITVSFQAVKAGFTNPVDTLRYE